LLEKGRIVFKRAYCDWSNYQDAMQEFHAQGVEMIDIPQTWLVYRQGLVLSVVGVAIGGLLAFNLTQVLGALLFRTEPSDPGLLGLAAAITLVTALAACMIPALRASRVDPVVALKAE
jgi:predicted lysophospholipase L1 biosynthesis ABC-type transport system permease subunit